MRRDLAVMLLLGAVAMSGCQQHQQPGQGDSPEEADQAIPEGAIPAPSREEQPGLGQEESPEPASDTTRGGATGSATSNDPGNQPPR